MNFIDASPSTFKLSGDGTFSVAEGCRDGPGHSPEHHRGACVGRQAFHHRGEALDQTCEKPPIGAEARKEPGEGRPERSERTHAPRRGNELHAPVLQGHGRGIPPTLLLPGRRTPPRPPPHPPGTTPQSGSGEVPLPPGLPFPRELLGRGASHPPAASEPFLPGALG